MWDRFYMLMKSSELNAQIHRISKLSRIKWIAIIVWTTRCFYVKNGFDGNKLACMRSQYVLLVRIILNKKKKNELKKTFCWDYFQVTVYNNRFHLSIIMQDGHSHGISLFHAIINAWSIWSSSMRASYILFKLKMRYADVKSNACTAIQNANSQWTFNIQHCTSAVDK